MLRYGEMLFFLIFFFCSGQQLLLRLRTVQSAKNNCLKMLVSTWDIYTSPSKAQGTLLKRGREHRHGILFSGHGMVLAPRN